MLLPQRDNVVVTRCSFHVQCLDNNRSGPLGIHWTPAQLMSMWTSNGMDCGIPMEIGRHSMGMSAIFQSWWASKVIRTEVDHIYNHKIE